MITPAYFEFLTALSENNTREWFASNKKKYDELKSDFEQFTGELISVIGSFDPGIIGLKPKDCIFRIYKDTRFSKDKAPYKTNFGAFFVGSGKNSGQAGYYLHIEPDGCFLGGGIYMPPAPVLKKIRDEIYHNFNSFQGIIEAPAFKKYFGTISGAKLTRPPKGYDSNFEGMDFLKYKDFTMIYPVNNEFFLQKEGMKKLMEIYIAMKPFNEFLNHSLEA
jgi:uncharacterized protein (TIGR02453 family)